MVDPPAIFGLHENADIASAQNEVFELLDSALRMNRAQSSSGDLTQSEYPNKVIKANYQVR